MVQVALVLMVKRVQSSYLESTFRDQELFFKLQAGQLKGGTEFLTTCRTRFTGGWHQNY